MSNAVKSGFVTSGFDPHGHYPNHPPAPIGKIADRLRGVADYAEHNYGKESDVTKACRAGDADAFMVATPTVTEYTDARLCSIQNAIICARIDAKEAGEKA